MGDIKTIRATIAQLGGSELKVLATDEGMQELFAQKQALYTEMHAAKRRAAEEAAKPFLEAIADLDKMYAILLRLKGENKDVE